MRFYAGKIPLFASTEKRIAAETVFDILKIHAACIYDLRARTERTQKKIDNKRLL